MPGTGPEPAASGGGNCEGAGVRPDSGGGVVDGCSAGAGGVPELLLPPPLPLPPPPLPCAAIRVLARLRPTLCAALAVRLP